MSKQKTGFRHGTPHALGVLLINLGTPDAPTVPAVRRYLAEFLSDPRVIELPRALWWPILHGIILRLRPRRSARSYRALWTDQGSPLLVIARRQAGALQERLDRQLPGPVQVALGMRYGNPSIASALAALRDANARRILVLPLYPQYSATTTASGFDAVTAELSTWRRLPELRFVNQYHDEPGYIAALAHSIRAYWAEQGEPDRLLFSFHGIPRDYLLRGDPYGCQCRKTARLTAENLALAPQRWQLAFQSRVGRKEWLRPYTEETLMAWGREGVKKVHVVCPGFAADCLETLEEIAVTNRNRFLAAGGEAFGYIPALNDQADHLELLTALVLRHVAGWPQTQGQAVASL
ncbi:ferrochelatase [Candidatus Thiosymbion oneisti]|uniref:ferrochelatase n=1 Tax=Candidatus Thiosymbion oneisti TaxID=589554 RepID=UPI000A6CFC1A|nr:ferrochelatase [Candidatus Thiosymbion oneisti]